MKAKFFEKDGRLWIKVEIDASNIVERVAEDQHKFKFKAAFKEYLDAKNPKPKPEIKKASSKKAKAKKAKAKK